MGEKIYWVDAEGGCLKLYDSEICDQSGNYSVVEGVEAFYMPDFDFASDQAYSYEGDIVRQVRPKPRKIVLPLMVRGAGSVEFMENLRLLLYAMYPTRGIGALKVYTVDGKTRMLNCYLQESPIVDNSATGIYTATNDIGLEPAYREWRKFPATLYVPFPYWYDPLEKETKVSYSSLSYPLKLYNEGDTVAWPIWSVGGPMTSVEIYNATTAKTMFITLTTTGSDTVYIDSRPLSKSVLLNHYTNETSKLSTDSIRFPLVSGANKINVTFTGATTYSELRVRWTENYLGV